MIKLNVDAGHCKGQGVKMRKLYVDVVAHHDGNIDILGACVAVVFKHCYLK